MQTIQFKVSDNYLNIVLTLLNNLKMDIVKELKIIKDNSEITKISKTESNHTGVLDPHSRPIQARVLVF